MISKKLLESLKAATVERQVEDAYNEMLKAEFPGIELSYPYGCDGYFEFEVNGNKHRAIVEYKFDEDMSSKAARSKVLTQVLFYMKRFELDGRPSTGWVSCGSKIYLLWQYIMNCSIFRLKQ